MKVYFEDDGHRLVVGEYVADILIEDDIIAEVKAEKVITRADFAQVRNYLQATGRRLGLIINFGQ